MRLEMESIAEEANVDPTGISFIESLRLIRDEWECLSVASPAAIPKRLETMRRSVKRYVLRHARTRTSAKQCGDVLFLDADRRRKAGGPASGQRGR